MERVALNLRASLNTDTVSHDVRPFGEDAPALKNTGIERDGGVTNIYQETTALTDLETVYSTNDNRISLGTTPDPNRLNVFIDGVNIGTVSAWGVEGKARVGGFDDVCLTNDGTFITASYDEGKIVVAEYAIPNDGDDLAAPLHTKSTTFTNIVPLSSLFTSLSIVRAPTIRYNTVLEFALRLGEQVIILNESEPNISITTSLQSITVLGTSTVFCSIRYNSYLIVAGANGRVGSFDGNSWRNYDGTGNGVGPYANGLLGGNQINCLAVYGDSLVVGGAGGRIASFNGSQWLDYNTSGTGLWNNATVISTDNVTAMTVWPDTLSGITYLVVGGSAGKIGSWTGTAWRLYNGVKGVRDNATAIGAVQINSIALYMSPSTTGTLLVAGASGRVGSMQFLSAESWAFVTSPAPLGGWADVAYGNEVWVTVAYTTSDTQGIARSTDNGASWALTTVPAHTGNWTSVAYGNGVWVAVNYSTSTSYSIARSTDGGVTWTFVTSPTTTGGWNKVTYAAGVWIASGGIIARSTDGGITWSNATTPAPGAWVSAAYGDSVWVAISSYDISKTTSVIRSTDSGLTWSYATLPSSPASSWRDIDYGNGVFIAVAQSTSTTAAVARSTDQGVTWTFVTTPTVVSSGWGSIGYGRGNWIATVLTTSGTAGIAKSVDQGLTWTFLTVSASAGSGWYNVAYANGVWIAVAFTTSTTAAILRSADTLTVAAYTTASTSARPTCNGTVVSTENILCVQPWLSNSYILICGSGGKIGYLTNGVWVLYNSGDPICSNSTALGSVPIYGSQLINNCIVIAGGSGRVASLDLSSNQWKNYDGSGTGVSGYYSNGTVIGTNTVYSLTEYDTKLIVSGANGSVGSFNADGSVSGFYQDLDTGTLYSNLLTNFNLFAYLYVYRYDPVAGGEGPYLVNLVGNTNRISYMLLDKSLKYVKTLAVQYAIPQTQGTRTRHITTSYPTYDASTIRAIGLVGYTTFDWFESTVQYPAILAAGVTGVSNTNIGFGCTDFNYNVSAVVNNFGQQFLGTESALYNIQNGNTSTPLNAYGKLNNRLQVPTTTSVEFRVLWINGVQSALSAAVVDGTLDNMGTLLTNIGEFDDSYTPQIYNDSTILYRYNGEHYIIKLGNGDTFDRLQIRDDSLIKINTISPNNIVDLTTRSLRIGSSDFNGRIQPVTGTSSSTAIPVAAVFTGDFSNGVDVGAKLFYLSSVGSNNIDIIGYKIPFGAPPKFSIDVYVNGVYSYSVLDDASELVDPTKNSLPYVPEQRNPIPIGAAYSYKTAKTKTNSLVLVDAYDGYYPGNELVGNYQFFDLFGGLYAFDGVWIYLISFNGNYISNPTRMANALGLHYITASPTEAYFISDYDNSLYTFSGGREIVKGKRMNQLEPVVQGIFNSHDAALLMTTANSFIWVRDQVVTQNAKPSTGAERLFSTSNGIRILEGATSYRYTYKPVGTVVPLTWQSAYFGLDKNLKNATTAYVVTIFNEAKTPITVDGVIRGFDQDRFDEQQVKLMLTSKDFDSNGYARVRIQPRKQKNLGTSIELSCASKIVLVDAFIEAVPDAAGTVNKARSR